MLRGEERKSAYHIRDNQGLVENKGEDEGRRECRACRDKKRKEMRKGKKTSWLTKALEEGKTDGGGKHK